MLLSIVECSDYRLYSKTKPKTPSVNKINEEIEIIGSVVGPDIATMRNLGARQAQGQWIFFKDEDCKVEVGTLYKIIQNLNRAQSNPDALGGVYRCYGKGLLEKAYNIIQRKWVLSGIRKNKFSGWHDGERLLGGALLIKKQALESIGGFNETIGWGGEEFDLTLRLREKGLRTAVSYRLIVEHRNSLSVVGFLKRAWYQNFNRSYFKIKSADVGLFRKSSYLETKNKFVLPILLFFGVASLGSASGQLARLFKKRRLPWKG